MKTNNAAKTTNHNSSLGDTGNVRATTTSRLNLPPGVFIYTRLRERGEVPPEYRNKVNLIKNQVYNTWYRVGQRIDGIGFFLEEGDIPQMESIMKETTTTLERVNWMAKKQGYDCNLVLEYCISPIPRTPQLEAFIAQYILERLEYLRAKIVSGSPKYFKNSTSTLIREYGKLCNLTSDPKLKTLLMGAVDDFRLSKNAMTRNVPAPNEIRTDRVDKAIAAIAPLCEVRA